MKPDIDFYTPFRATGYVTSDAASELDDIANRLVDAAYATPTQVEDTEAEALRLRRDLLQYIQSELDGVKVPTTLSESKAEYWKAGARAAIRAMNAALNKPKG